MTDWLHTAILPIGILLGLLGCLRWGFVLGRSGREELVQEAERVSSELARSEAQAREHARQVSRLHTEQRTFGKFARAVPAFVQAMNGEKLSERDIPKYVFNLVDEIFEPELTLLYLVRPSETATGGPQALHLIDRRGNLEVAPSMAQIRVGDGRIGFVAEYRVNMLADDWLNMARTEGRTIESNQPGLHFDLLGPLVDHEDGDDPVLGVLCVSGPATRPRDERLMIQTVANLATIAYTNLRNRRTLQDLADYDGLTRLLNKRVFVGRKLAELMLASEKESEPLSVFVFDIDHFKNYNDKHGHLDGDDILRGVAQVLRASLRPGDLACRYGGEEFVVAMPHTRGDDGLAAADRIRAAIERFPFPKSGSQPLGRITISGGVAQFPVDGARGNILIEHADQALYAAKRDGRNRVIRYHGVEIGSDAEDETDSSDRIHEPEVSE